MNQIFAFTFTSDSYRIDWGNFNSTSGSKTSNTRRLTDTVGQMAPGLYGENGQGYRVKAGFQYIYDTLYNFSFSVTNLDINFGYLVPDVGSTAHSVLTISAPSGNGYQIMVIQDHQLKNGLGQTIPDTRGDNNLATISQSDVWTNSSTYGFGFNAQGNGTSSYFPTANHYRQFASLSDSENNQILASENSPGRNRTQTVTYKVNVSPLQSSGTYRNSINYIAVPKY